MMDREKKSYLNALMKRKDEEDFGQKLDDLNKTHEKDLAMGRMIE